MTDFETLALPYFAPLLASWTAKTGWPCRIVTGQPDAQEACKILSFTSRQKDKKTDSFSSFFASSQWCSESDTEIDGVVVTDSWTLLNEPVVAVEHNSTGVQTSLLLSHSDRNVSSRPPWWSNVRQSVPPSHISPTRSATPVPSDTHIQPISPARQRQFNPAARATLTGLTPPKIFTGRAASVAPLSSTPTASSSVSASSSPTRVTIKLPGRMIPSREMPPPERPRERHSSVPPRQARFKPRQATPAVFSASSKLVPASVSKVAASYTEAQKSTSRKSSRRSTPVKKAPATDSQNSSVVPSVATDSPGTSKHTSPEPLPNTTPEPPTCQPPDFGATPLPRFSTTPPSDSGETQLALLSSTLPPDSTTLPDFSTTPPPNLGMITVPSVSTAPSSESVSAPPLPNFDATSLSRFSPTPPPDFRSIPLPDFGTTIPQVPIGLPELRATPRPESRVNSPSPQFSSTTHPPESNATSPVEPANSTNPMPHNSQESSSHPLDPNSTRTSQESSRPPHSGISPPSDLPESSTAFDLPDSNTTPPPTCQDSSNNTSRVPESNALDASPESRPPPLEIRRPSRQCSNCNSAIQNITRAGRTRRSKLPAASTDLCTACSLYAALNNRRRPALAGASLSAPPTTSKESPHKGRKRPRPSEPANKSPARGRKHRRLTENEDVSSGASESSTLVGEAIRPEHFPSKMRPLVKMLQDANYSFAIESDQPVGPRWKQVVDSWLAIEYVFLSKENAKEFDVPDNTPAALPSAHRPECIRHWLQRARQTNWRAHRAGRTGIDSKVIENVPAAIGNLQMMDEQFCRWWQHLKKTHEESLANDDGPILLCPGLNGLLSVVSVLFFWAEGIQELENIDVDGSVDAIVKLKTEWMDAIADASATFDSLLNEMKTA